MSLNRRKMAVILPPEATEKTKRIQVDLPLEWVAKLDAIAKQGVKAVSRNRLLEYWIELFIKEQVILKKTAPPL